jgi:hypothetical protein
MVIPAKLIVIQPVANLILCFHRIQKFFAIFTEGHHWTCLEAVPSSPLFHILLLIHFILPSVSVSSVWHISFIRYSSLGTDYCQFCSSEFAFHDIWPCSTGYCKACLRRTILWQLHKIWYALKESECNIFSLILLMNLAFKVRIIICIWVQSILLTFCLLIWIRLFCPQIHYFAWYDDNRSCHDGNRSNLWESALSTCNVTISI